MKRLGGICSQVVDFANLLYAYRKARRGKGQNPDVARFALNLEHELLALQRELTSGTYQPGAYRLFTVYERKARLIAAAPFRDRVVHHAVMNLVEPPLDRTFIDDSYACRRGKGTHAAVTRYQGWARCYTYVLKMDVSQYFPSIDHDTLKQKLRRRIKDRWVLGLLDTLIETSPEKTPALHGLRRDQSSTSQIRRTGIPIGNLTSQFFANLYLDDLDHYIKEALGVRAYLRYVDDMVALENDKARLDELRGRVADRLAEERLQLHPRKAQVTRTAQGLNLLGYRVYPNGCRLRDDNGHRFARKLRGFARAYAQGRTSWRDFNPAVQSWIGHARHADTQGLRRQIFAQVVFRKGE
jgi:RNA-directed DNA polymerase